MAVRTAVTELLFIRITHTANIIFLNPSSLTLTGLASAVLSR